MRRLLIAFAAAGALVGSGGCFVNEYSSDPNRRVVELLNQSEDLRQMNNEWRRFWFNDMPSHMTPERVDGGIMP